MDRGDYDAARQLLKEAASLAPLRGDIRELLVEAIEKSAAAPPRRKKAVPGSAIVKGSTRPSRKARPEPDAPEKRTGGARVALSQGAFGSRRRRSPWMLIRTLIALVLFTALIALGAYIWRVAGSRTSRGGLPLISQPEPTPTPDPMLAEREAMARKAEAQADAHNYDAAIKEMKKLLGTNPPDPAPYQEKMAHYHFMVGRANYKQGRVDKAIEHLERAVEFDIHNPEHFLWLGMSHYKRGRIRKGSLAIKDLSAARQMFDRVIELNPDELEGYKYLAQTLIAQGKPVDGANAYRQIVARAPDSPEAEHAKKQLKMMGMR